MSITEEGAATFFRQLGKLVRDSKGRMQRPHSGLAEGPEFGGPHSVKGGEGMVTPSGVAEGAEFGGPYSARGETMAGQGAPSREIVPVAAPVRAEPNFTVVDQPSTALAPRASTDVSRFLEEAEAAKAKSAATAGRWGLPVAAGAAGIGAAGLYDDRGRSIGPAEGASGQAHSGPMLSAADAYRLGMIQRPPREEEHPAVAAATAAVRNVPTPPPRPADAAPQRAPIDWGDPDRASDFFLADRELQARKSAGEDFGFARGGMPTAHEHALHKAMHIIHHLLSRGGRA
jgi:hypothetical protein